MKRRIDPIDGTPYYLKFLKRSNDSQDFWILDPYGCGCAGMCLYCYAHSLLLRTSNWAPTPLHANRRRMLNAIKNLMHKEDSVRIGALTDPFQPEERRLHLTRDVIRALCAKGIKHTVVTKYSYVAHDDNIAVYDKDLTQIQVTLTSTDDEFASRYEGGSKVSRRIEAINKLSDAGFDVVVRLAPYVPDFVDQGHVDFERLASIRTQKVYVDFLRTDWHINAEFGKFIDVNRYSFKDHYTNQLPIEEKEKYMDLLMTNDDGKRQYRLSDYCEAHSKGLCEYYKGGRCEVRPLVKGKSLSPYCVTK